MWGHRLASPLGGATGIGRYTIELTLAMHARADREFDVMIGACKEEAEPTWVPSGIPIKRMTGPRSAVHLAWMIAGRPYLDRAAGRPALVHALLAGFPVPSRAPLIYTVHDLMPLTNPEWFTRLEALGYARGMRHAARHAAMLVADSQFVADLTAERFGIEPHRITTVHAGVGDRFHHAPSAEAVAAVCAKHGLTAGTYALYVGSISVRKNVEILVRALAAGGRALDGITLVFAGPDRGALDDLRAAAASSGVGDRIRLLGFVDDDDLPGLLAAAAALVHPSTDEGFGFTPIESMAVGTPAIVSAAGSLPEIVGDAALVVDQGDAEAWAHALESLLADDAMRADLVARGKARSARFTWAETARQVEDVWRRVVS